MTNPQCPIDLDDADPMRLARAVAVVQADYEKRGWKPGAEHWQTDTRGMRAKLVRDVLVSWRRDVGIADHEFALIPWHDDYVLRAWVAFRKLRWPEKLAAWGQFGVEAPQRFRPIEA